jgi:hypothetical protein
MSATTKGKIKEMRYNNFMQDTQDIESAVCALAPRWGTYMQHDLDGLRATLYALDRIALMVETLTKKVVADIAKESSATGSEHFDNVTSQKLFAVISSNDRSFKR